MGISLEGKVKVISLSCCLFIINKIHLEKNKVKNHNNENSYFQENAYV